MKMKTMMLALCISACFATMASAEDKEAAKGPAMTTEQRQKMADGHEKMAACLRSERPLGECHEELMKSCQETMGANCPMMGKMGGMKHHGRMMPSEPAK